MKWKRLDICDFIFKWRIPKWQGIKVGGDSLTQPVGRLTAGALPLPRKTEVLEMFAIDSDLNGIFLLSKPIVFCESDVLLVPVAHVLHGGFHFKMKHAVVFRIPFPLLWVGFTLERLLTILTSPSRQEPYP